MIWRKPNSPSGPCGACCHYTRLSGKQVYGNFPLTPARHPSKTDQRMMLRARAALTRPGFNLQYTISEGEALFNADGTSIGVTPTAIQDASR